MGKAIFTVMVVIVLTKVLGFLRDIFLAYFYGASDISDAYLIATTIPHVFFSFVAAGITASFIPTYTRVLKIEGEEAARKFTANLMNIVLIGSVFLISLLLLFPEAVVTLFASGFEDRTMEIAVMFTRISAIGILFTALMFVFKGYLEVHEKYTVTALSGWPLNILTILFIGLSSMYGLYLLALGTVVALAAQFLFVVPVLIRIGYKHTWRISLSDPHIKKTLALAVPVILGVSINQINVLVDRTLASRILEGGISAITYSDRVVHFIQALFITAVVTVLFPRITKLAVAKDLDQLKQILGKVITVVSLLVIPSTVGILVFSEEIVRFLFGRGEFGEVEVWMTSGALFFYAFGLLGIGLREVLVNVFYSLEDSKTPMVNACWTVGINISLNLILSIFMGINGLALATSISALFSAVFLYNSLVKKIGRLHDYTFLLDVGKALCAAVAMAFAARGSHSLINYAGADLWALGGGVVVGAVIYGSLLSVMRLSDMAFYKSKLRRQGRVG
ncbi:murein biosynthesis integral membrane protein MurJ [Indiicoccus explosivorum]|uniref:murein biosynthesis integral membrane protein MurJ n=1 Tax=Indiicoccus explosivorum TaxID=1917864 RepID=UPI000B44EFCF|nr:murein biosynthesis integral membrane protein MurJ [Indiicoccus explosivorum]